uniref:NYN domain-containing protein n=1 Tax=Panagrolaimus sp. ES5 TaxID=591445 RepID=A0AC34GNY5_9BILA
MYQEPVGDNSAEKCWVFIDNSNLIIQGWKYYGNKNNFAIQDPRMRVDMGRLTNYVIGKRSTEGHPRAWLHGSQPPSVDTVWKAIEKKDIISAYTNKEKSVDTGLGSDATEQACENKDVGGTFIFVSGDRDYIFLMEDKILKRGFKIDVFTWESALSKEYYALQKRHPEKVEIFKIDEFADRVCYARYRFRKGRIPRDRTIVIHFDKVNIENAGKLVQDLDRLFLVPFLYQWDKNYTLFLSAIPAEQKNFRRGQHFDIGDLKELYDTNDEEFLKDVGCAMYDFTVLYNINKKKIMESAKYIGTYKDDNFMTAVEWYNKPNLNTFYCSNNESDNEGKVLLLVLKHNIKLIVEEGIPKGISGNEWNVVSGENKQKFDIKKKKYCGYEFRCSHGLSCKFKASLKIHKYY